jgi:hypothetical protein
MVRPDATETSCDIGAFELQDGSTSVAFGRLTKRFARGWTYLAWRSTRRVAGFNVYGAGRQLNRGLVTSRGNRYHFRIHRIVHSVRLLPVPLT